MKMKARVFITVLALLMMAATATKAQFIEDALRLTQKNGYSSPRSGALGVAFHGISDDFSALSYNPAGLSLVGKSEISFGFGFLRNSTETDFLSNVQSLSSNDAYLTHAGVVAPFKTKYGNASIAIGYVLESNFDNNYEYSGFNQNSSYINYRAYNGPDDINENMASYLYLGDIDGNGNVFTPITDSLTQKGFVQEKGGLHKVVGGAGFDLSDFASLGFTIEGKWGTYDYTREYEEIDTYDKYNVNAADFSDVDMQRFWMEESVLQDISGISGSVGIQGKLGNFVRFGANIKFPTFYSIEEEFYQEANAFFDDGSSIDPPYNVSGQTSYKVTTPWEYSGGVSVHAAGITFSAGVSYSDVTQLEFSDATEEVERLNRTILTELVGQTSWGFGVEYNFPILPLAVRGSFSSTTSPYSDDVPGATINNFALGGGIYLAKNIRLDGMFRFTDYSQMRANYGENMSQYVMNLNPLDIGLQLTYRY